MTQSEQVTLSQTDLEAELLDDVVRHLDDAIPPAIREALPPEVMEQIGRDFINPRRSRDQLDMLERSIGDRLRGKTILELGSGYGLTVAVARTEYGSDAYGLEPSDDEFTGSLDIGERLLDRAGVPRDAVYRGVAEHLPFADESFDVVFSSQVLEHVQNPQSVIDESVRVLRPDGYMHMVVPNYGSFWEGHYGVFWIPHMPKWMARVYLRLLRRDPSYIDQIQLISHGRLRRMLRRHRDDVVATGWGIGVWEERMTSVDFRPWGMTGRLVTWVKWLHRLGLVRLAVLVGRLCHWQSPVILTARKGRG